MMTMLKWAAVLGVAILCPLATAGCDVNLQAASVEGTFERTLPVSGPVDLDVRTGSGDIHIRPGSGGSVHVVARIRAQGDLLNDQPEHRIAQIQANPPIQQTGGTITIG